MSRFILLPILISTFGLASCGGTPDDHRTIVDEDTFSRTRKVCDEDRAIYTYKSGYAGGIAIVENARECGGSD